MKVFIRTILIFLLVLILPGLTFAKVLKVSLIDVADSQTLRPGANDFFTYFSPPRIVNGVVVFRAAGKQREGIYVMIGGVLREVASAYKTEMPGRKILFIRFKDDDIKGECLPSVFRKKVVFLGAGPYSRGIYLYQSNKISLIADNKTIISGGNYGLFQQFSDVGFIGNGNVAFVGSNRSVLGIYFFDEQRNLKVGVDTNTKIPNGYGNFTDIYSPSFSSDRDGENAFVFLGKGNGGQFGLYLKKNGRLISVVHNKTQIPNGVGYFVGISKPSFNTKTGSIAFIGKGILGQSGIYLYDGTKLTKVVDQRDIIPGTVTKFDEFNNPTLSMNLNGILFYGKNIKGIGGVYLYTKKRIFTVLTLNDKINNKTIKQINISRKSLSKNQVALSVVFSGKATGIYIGKLTFSSY